MNEVGIPTDASAEPGVKPHRGNIFKDGLPLDNYPLSDYEMGQPMASNFRKGATGDPINHNPDIVAGEQSVEKFGLARGPQGANS